ncbi:LPS export ABC transporter periplasmic protein LptC [Moraxella atlantae]|uniref:LPS export ABC transporter periplasmic protein LptC n=1 Tax=Faucicola atlantae TaxID=34059 RepID=UPI003752CBC3
MSNKVLLVLGLLLFVVAAYFYHENRTALVNLNLEPSDIDYQATDVQGLQTDDNGAINYRVNAARVLHYQQAQVAALDNLQLNWRNPQNAQTVTITAKHAQLDENTQKIVLADHVTMRSHTADGKPDLTLTGQDWVGDLNRKTLSSQQPIHVEQGNNAFDAARFSADTATGDYAFERVQMQFMPPNQSPVANY